jgi:phage terminase large subunit
MSDEGIRLSEFILPAYRKAFNWKGRYYFCKGGRGSGKSKNEFLRAVLGVMMYPDVNVLVVRRFAATLEGSCFQDVKWACRQLKVAHLWKHTISPMKSTFLPTGQIIRYRGLDDPEKVKSIAVEHGYLCWSIFEEISEVKDFEKFLDVVNSIRGIPPDYTGNAFEQIRGIFNPTSPFWLKTYAFDRCDPTHENYDPEWAKRCLCQTTTVEDNPYVTEEYKKSLRDLQFLNPRTYGPHYLGEWGELGDVIYTNVEMRDYDMRDIRNHYPHGETIAGMDFGFTAPTALVICYFDQQSRQLWVYDEIYDTLLTIEKLGELMLSKRLQFTRIVADNEDPRAITELFGLGFKRLVPAIKGKNSVINGIQYLQEWKIIVHPRCKNFYSEIVAYVWDIDKETGKPIDRPIDKNDHACNALMYAGEWMRNYTSARPHRERVLQPYRTVKPREIVNEIRL